jgi:hypothetical protein
MFKRLLPVAGLGGLLTVALAATAAAGGGGYAEPGHYQFNDTTAYASLSDASGDSVSVYVDRGQHSFKAARTPGAPVSELSGTMLSVNRYVAGSFGYGCWIIPDSAFTVAGNLSSARLTVHATPDMPCPGDPVGGASGGKPGLQSVIGYGGGGGEPPTEITDIVLNVTWIGNGALWTNSNSGMSHCGSYSSNFHTTFSYEYGTASGSVDNLTGLSDALASVAHGVQTSDSTTTPSGACNPLGF